MWHHRRSSVGAAAMALVLTLTMTSRADAQGDTRSTALTDHEQDVIDAYDIMSGVTLGLMGATASLGLAQLYNLPTSFGEGACARDEAIFGNYACSGAFSLVHGIFGIATAASYTATGALALAAPNRDFGTEDTVTDVLGVVHGVGIGLTAVMGLLAANPGILGITGQAAESFSRHLRVVHWLVALVMVSAFATHVIVDHVD